jgi:hypothetical protein
MRKEYHFIPLWKKISGQKPLHKAFPNKGQVFPRFTQVMRLSGITTIFTAQH